MVSGGNIKTNEEDFLIRANNKNYYANGLQNLVLRKDSKGNIVRLGQVAKISDKFSETPISTFVDYNSAVVISTSSTNSEDLLESAKIINSFVDEFNSNNERFKLTVLKDYSIALKQRTNLLLENGGIGIFLVLIF